MIRSLLIANRGEIACRIIRTARAMGIRTIAVHSDADTDAPHVRAAHEAVRIGPAPARESYLDTDRLIAAARAAGADAIHPGYGFLSEKPVLPRACEAAGLVFVGPSARCIEAMGSKIGAKAIAREAGIPCVPGSIGGEDDPDRLRREAAAIGYPLMVKASAGGGGKGMRAVERAQDLDAALAVAAAEAQAAFGDGTLLLERLVRRPRHLEVQIAGDRFGTIVHLFERDCSVQRHHQKLIEEAPAPNLAAPVREKLLDRAVRLARAIAYDNLGTVEFILDEDGEEPWFLEMNTRLQVEHPVTEAVTGFDLVEWQIRIASGEPVPVPQEAIGVRGWAMEARITAEKADQGFMPDAGPVLACREPPGLRFDSGIAAGSMVTLHYDSLLAKAIAHGGTREEARRALAAGLAQTVILGPATTAPFLTDVLDLPAFREGRATTRLLGEAWPDGWSAPPGDGLLPALAAVLRVETAAVSSLGPPPTSPWRSLSGFRLLAAAGARARAHLRVAGEDEPVVVESLGDGRHAVHIGRTVREVSVVRSGVDIVVRDGDRRLAGIAVVTGDEVALDLGGAAWRGAVRFAVETAAGAGAATQGAGALAAPMPGVVAEIKVSEGARVTKGQVVAVLESMKLFMPLEAGCDGIVTEIAGRPGETVPAGRVLLVVTPDPPVPASSPGDTP